MHGGCNITLEKEEWHLRVLLRSLKKSLWPCAFIGFLVFETPMKHSHSFLKYYFSTAESLQKNRILWQIANISQSNGRIGHPLGFMIDRLNTSASLYRIAPCLKGLSQG